MIRFNIEHDVTDKTQKQHEACDLIRFIRCKVCNLIEKRINVNADTSCYFAFYAQDEK